MNKNRFLGFWLLFSLFLLACQPNHLQSKTVAGQFSADLTQNLVPESKGGTLGKGLVPESKGGTLGQGLVPESKGGTLGKGLVPESKGGTLGRFTLRGQVLLPGFHLLSQASNPIPLQLLPVFENDVWLDFETDPEGRFEIQNIPVDTVLLLKTVAKEGVIPLQALIFNPANKSQTLLSRNLDLYTSAEALLLGALQTQVSELKAFLSQDIAAASYRESIAEVALLLEKQAFQKSKIFSDPIFLRAQKSIQRLFETYAAGLSSNVLTKIISNSETETAPAAVFVQPESGRSYSLGSLVSFVLRFQKPFSDSVKLELWSQAGPLTDSQAKPLSAWIPPFSTEPVTLNWPTEQAGGGNLRIEARLLNLNGARLAQISGPEMTLYASGGPSQRIITHPLAVRVQTANGLPFDSDTLVRVSAPGGFSQTILAGKSSPADLSFDVADDPLQFEVLRVAKPQVRATTQIKAGQAGPVSLTLPPVIDSIQAQIPALPLGLVGEWLGEGNGADSLGVANAILQNVVGFGPGVQGQAFALNGQMGGLDVASIDFARQDYSAECWFKTDFNQTQMLIESVPGFKLQILASGQLAFAHQPPAFVTSSSAFNDNRWHHVVAVKKGSQETLYLDGQPAQTQSSNLLNINNSVALHVGFQTTPNQLPFKGLIDNLRVYQQGLSAEQVKSLFLRRTLTLSGQGFGFGLTENKVSVSGTLLELISATSSQIQALLPDSISNNALIQIAVGNSQSNALSFNAFPPRLDGVNRSLFLSGDVLTLTGTGFDSFSQVTVAGSPLTIQTVLPASLKLTLPAAATSGNLQVSNGALAFAGTRLSAVPVAPLAWWRAEGDAQDVQGNYPGVLNGGVTFTPGKVGQAFLLQNSGAFIDLGSIDAFQGDFTWTGWFRNQGTSTQSFVSGTQAGLPGFQLGQQTGLLSFLHRFPYAGTGGIQDLAGNLLTGQWHHFAVVKNNLFQTLYLDGQVVDALDNATNFNTALQVLLGRSSPADSSADFKGALDEIMLFNQALSAPQIELIYQYSR
jgi:hypothetical protein